MVIPLYGRLFISSLNFGRCNACGRVQVIREVPILCGLYFVGTWGVVERKGHNMEIDTPGPVYNMK